MTHPLETASFSLKDWLLYCENNHPQAIDLGLERVAQVAKCLELNFKVPVFMVAGTNGKGSTCIMLESIALQAGYRTGVYTSPHLNKFEERCRLNGQMVDEQELLPHFQKVEAARQNITLTYFEFTTLAILSCLMAAQIDVAILEVGLGGRLDAVNVIDADCAIITSIDIDHTEYLGPDRESIGFEKAGILRTGKPVVVGDPKPPQTLLNHAHVIQADLRCIGKDFSHAGDRQQWSWRGQHKKYSGLSYPALRGANQLLNASAVLAAFEAVESQLPISAQAVRQGLALLEWPGRFQILPGQPVTILDVAHNPHAVATLAHNLDQMGFYPQTHAVFGAMADKDVKRILEIMQPLVDCWHFTDLPTLRAMKAHELAQLWDQLDSPKKTQTSSKCYFLHSNPQEALQLARTKADPVDRIVVFGSFFTVGGVS